MTLAKVFVGQFYYGIKSGKRVKLASLADAVARFYYVYDNGKRMTPDQTMPQDRFQRVFENSPHRDAVRA